MNLQFKCPRCGYDVLEEVLTDVVVSTTIEDVLASNKEDPSPEVSYVHSRNRGGVVDCYQCAKCAHELRDANNYPASSTDELVAWLFDHNMLTPDTGETDDKTSEEE